MKRLALFFLLLVNCGDRADPLSLVKRFRVPVAQLYVQSETQLEGRGCIAEADAAPFYCQQFPLVEPTKEISQTFYILLVAMTPGAMTTLTSQQGELYQLSLSNGAESELAGGGGFTPYKGSALTVTELAAEDHFLKKLYQKESSIHVQTFVYEVTAKNDSLTSPQIFEFRYQLKAAYSGKSEVEEGRFVFYYIPQTQAKNTTVNSPPELEINIENGATLKKNEDKEISLTITDPDTGGGKRIQWFISQGKLSRENAKTTQWKPEKSGSADILAVVRDLQGGAAFIHRSVTVN